MCQMAKSEAATSASNASASATAAANSASDAAASVGAINVITPKSVDIAPTTVGGDSIAIGRCAKASDNGNYSIVIGTNAHAHAIGTVVIGPGAVDTIDSKGQNVIIGDNAQVNGAVVGSVVLGSYSIAVKDAELAIGHGATDTGIAETTREITHVSAPTADTSASTKKYTDDNDAKTLTDAKKYTDANTSNALVGTVSGKLLHVEDAWPGKPLGLTIDGAYKQDGTPSPDNPVPITVIENPVLWITGKNLQKYPFPYGHPKVDNLNGVIVTDNGDGSVTATGTPSIESYYNFDFTSGFEFARGADVVVSAASNPSYHVETITDTGTSPCINSITRLTNKVPTDALKVRSFLVFTAGVNHNATFFPQFEIGTTATAYSKYVGTSTTIVLPDEHPYLAALPDGTHDEIVVDKYGNASLVARVQKVDVSNLPAPSLSTALDNGLTRYQYHGIVRPKAKQDSPAFAPAFSSVVQYMFKKQGMYVSESYIVVGATSDPTDALKAGGYIYTTLANPVTYQLGKLDIPSLPETISNVWTDAELTTNMRMTYKRDINVAFDNLVQAVVAATAGE